MLLSLVVGVTMVTVIKASQNVATFSTEELRFLASLELCKHFGGACGHSCPFRYIRHRWNVPLCPSREMECCIGPPPPFPGNGENYPHDDSTTTSTTSFITSSSPSTSNTAAAPTGQAHQGQSQSGNLESCGFVPAAANAVRRKRIVGGALAPQGNWPWLVALRSMLGSHACSGALVNQRWIVTAAHCFKHISNPSLWRVRVGEYDLLSHDTGEVDYHIESIITNPGYGAQRGQNAQNQTLYTRYVNDIALVRLREEVGVEPVCLPSNQNTDELHGECWVAGWGVTMDQMNEDQRLRQVSGPIISNDRCSQMWNTTLQDNMVCFGDGTYGPCAGDSGGPLSCQNSQGSYTLEGVVSWGTEDCNLSGYPSVFTRVRPYLSWIRQHLQQNMMK